MKLEPMIYTTNIENSIEIYREILEFEIDEYYPKKENPTWVCIRIGNDRFGIGKAYSDINHKLHPRGVDGSRFNFISKSQMWVRYMKNIEIK
ncbi:MAG: hypothetical protein ACXAC8_10860 [Candidatus Hodarchaeales archaeon]|jgi:hypothetical protein